MADIAIRNVSEMRGAFRLDAEFWLPEYDRIERAISSVKHVSLGKLAADVRKGIFYILASEYTESGVPFYRSSNVGEILMKETDVAFISDAKDKAEAKTSLRYGDIVLGKTGKEAAAIVTVDRCNISQDVIGIRLNDGAINPFFLVAFLNSDLGILQMRRWFQGQVQVHLTLPDARRVLVPVLPDAFQRSVEKKIRSALQRKADSTALYASAEDLLLCELGLGEVDLSPTLFYERDFSETCHAARLDAEFFSPRVQRIIATLSEGGLTIADVAKLAKRHFKPKIGVPFQYIEIADIGASGDAESKEVAGEEAPCRATWIVKPGDVITTTVRPIRRLSAIVSKNQMDFVCSSGFAVLQPNDIQPELLMVYLRLAVVAELLDLHTTASMYPAISTADLLRIPFRMPHKKARRELAEMMRSSFAARDESRRLLDEAKRMVEAAVLAEGR